MANLPEFIANHLALVLIFVGLLAYILYSEFTTQQSSRNINPQQAVNLMNHSEAVVIDIRPPNAYKAGHIINALNMSEADLEKAKKYMKKHIILVCETGQKTPLLSRKLQKNGFEHIASLRGGMAAWRQADLPLTS